MPGATSVVQEAGVPGRPSISTRHSLQLPKLFSESVAQSFGTLMPASAAARMTEVPSGTVTSWPSMVRVTGLHRRDDGRAVVEFLDQGHAGLHATMLLPLHVREGVGGRCASRQEPWGMYPSPRPAPTRGGGV